MQDTNHEQPAPGRTVARLARSPVFWVFIAVVGVLLLLLRPAPAPDTDQSEIAIASRIEKVGRVAFAAAQSGPRSGQQVYEAQCAGCHASGALGSPRLGDVDAWKQRIPSGLDSLLLSALRGKKAMPAQGGGSFSDDEIAAAVVYMANAAGAQFALPVSPGPENPLTFALGLPLAAEGGAAWVLL